MAAQDEQFFQQALARKYDILQQQANTANQDVTQRPQMQGAADAAAMERARLTAQAQLDAQQIQGGFGLQQTALAGQNSANVENLRGGFGLQQQRIAGQNTANVANIQGGWGLEDAKTRAQAMMQPQFDVMPNPDHDPRQKGSKPYLLMPKNASGSEYLSTPPALPQGMGTQGTGMQPTGLPSGPAAGMGQGLTQPELGLPGGAAVAPAAITSVAGSGQGGQPGYGLPGSAPRVPYLDTPQAFVPDREGTRTYATDRPTNEVRRVVSPPDSASLGARIAGLKGGNDPNAPKVPYLDDSQRYRPQRTGRMPYGNGAGGL